MVKHPFLIAFIFCLWITLVQADQVVVEAAIDQNRGQINQPLTGTITITSDKESSIDSHSFSFEKKPLETAFVKKITLSESTIISIYRFTLPPESEGTHTLSPISVKVGNKTYQSAPSTYEVQESSSPFKPVPIRRGSTVSSAPPLLRLEAFVKGSATLYLGERTTLVYRISYNRSIDLTKSDLPFVHAQSFTKIGDSQIRDEQQGDVTIQEIAQEIEAAQIGSFKLGPSTIEGHTYELDLAGKKIYDPQLMKAEAAAVEIIVKPFPPEQQPESFNGALGKVQAEISLKSASKVSVGDTIELLLTLQGISNLADQSLPSLLCQPGFSGFFQVNDLPPAAEIEGESKQFHLELRPLTAMLQEIPSIELSSFDPKTRQFHVVHTKPIPLAIALNPAESLPEPEQLKQVLPSQKELEALLLHPVPPVEIKGLVVKEAQVPILQRGWILWIIPLGLLMLWMQVKGHQIWMNRPRPQVRRSELLLRQARGLEKQPMEAIRILQEALLSRLNESGMHVDLGNIESLADEGIVGRIKAFLLKLQALQYSPEKAFDFSALIHEAEQLMGTG